MAVETLKAGVISGIFSWNIAMDIYHKRAKYVFNDLTQQYELVYIKEE